MKFVENYLALSFWLIFFGQNAVVESTFVMDLVNNLASSHAHCMILISELNSESDFNIETSNLSKISLLFYNTNTSFPDLSAAGKYCLYNLLIFDSVDSSLQFLNRYIDQNHDVHSLNTLLINAISRSVRHEDKGEHSYYLRRNQSFYIHVLNDWTTQEEVKSLFLSDFYSKVLNTVAVIWDNSAKDSLSMWTKSPCDSMGPKLTNVWKKSSGFRKVYIFCMSHSNRISKGYTMLDTNIAVVDPLHIV